MEGISEQTLYFFIECCCYSENESLNKSLSLKCYNLRLNQELIFLIQKLKKWQKFKSNKKSDMPITCHCNAKIPWNDINSSRT